MNKLQELLATKDHLILDGAMGTMLMEAGLEQGAPPEEWNVAKPDKVRAVHRDYIEAGSNIVLTNSFGGTSFRLKLHNLQDRVAELNKAAAANARAEANAANHPVLVGGSMGPTGELFAPMGTMMFEEAKAAFAEQAAALDAGGADILWVETMSDLEEVRAAVEGAKSVSNLPIAATMTFDTHGHTMMGVSPAQALETLRSFGLAALGANCGNGPDEIEEVIQTMRALSPDTILIAKANAGIPHWIDEELVYDGTPEVMADYTKRVYGMGAQLIGGCCGSSPAHIKAMAKAFEGEMFELGETAVAATTAPSPAKPARERRRRRRDK
ncbi:MAG: betaine--homocysteine S-methyltransferase [Chloroflexi bacterium]|nr:betaine--homocysteine S-methyltransferase [Chloroflexota bacterium]